MIAAARTLICWPKHRKEAQEANMRCAPAQLHEPAGCALWWKITSDIFLQDSVTFGRIHMYCRKVFSIYFYPSVPENWVRNQMDAIPINDVDWSPLPLSFAMSEVLGSQNAGCWLWSSDCIEGPECAIVWRVERASSNLAVGPQKLKTKIPASLSKLLLTTLFSLQTSYGVIYTIARVY